jgi:Tol biopolymer transport system component
VLFESSRASFRDLYLVPREGGAPVRLTDNREGNFDAVWSPDGKQIAFSSSAVLSRRDGEEDLFVIRPNGTDIANLTRETPGDVVSFSWHPAADSIAVANKSGRKPGKISLVEPGSTRVVTLSGSDHDDADPAWSLDGRYLAFTTKVNGRPDIWLMRADGKQRTQLTTDARGAWLPRWIEVEGR